MMCFKKFLRIRYAVAALYILTVIIITILSGNYYHYINSIASMPLDAAHIDSVKEHRFLIEIYIGMIIFLTTTYFIVAQLTRKYESSLLRQATYDSLTGLPNRSLLNEELSTRLALAKKTNTQLGLFFIDLDNFKQVNDSYDHQVGDQLLVEVASRFKDVLRKDDFVARLGGDEFVVITNNYDIAPRSTVDVENIAKNLHHATTNKIEIDNITLYSNSSIGISVYPQCASTESELLRTADLAMYQCKKQGKNQHLIYTPVIEIDILEEFELESQLRKAIIDDKCKDFYMVYQPQFSPSRRHVTGFESLVRWKNDQFPDVGPDKFIPIIEKLRLIDNLGECVFNKVLSEYSAFRKKCKLTCANFNHPSKISINVSSLQINEDLVDIIYEKMMCYGLEPNELEIEITESVLIEEMHESTVIKKLSDLGIGVSIDDFGTGYSSLMKLGTMPFTSIKIDKAFVDQIGNDLKGEAVILMILILGQELGVTIVAEGVETDAQSNFLIEHCPGIILQGYLYSAPVTIDNLSNTCGAVPLIELN